MAQIQDVRTVKSLLTRIESIMGQLDDLSVEGDSVNGLCEKFKLYDSNFTKLARLTYNGDLPPALRKKVPKIKQWLTSLQESLNKENASRTNKKALLDLSEVEKYQDYCEKISHYFDEVFPTRYENISQGAESILEKYKVLKKNMRHFDLPSDLVNPDLLRAEDAEMNLAQPKTVAAIIPIVKEFASFIKKVQVLLSSLEAITDELTNVDVKELFVALNRRNILLKSLLINFSNLNQAIYAGNFASHLAIRTKYHDLLAECIKRYPIPETFSSKLKLEDSPEHEVDRSIKRTRERAMTEPVDTFVSPWQREMDIPVTVQAPPKITMPVLSPEDKVKYESLWNSPQGDKLSPEEKSKYEALWAYESAIKLLKLARKSK